MTAELRPLICEECRHHKNEHSGMGPVNSCRSDGCGCLEFKPEVAVANADFIREHDLANEYWCSHQAAEALEKGDPRSREEMLKTETPFCDEKHCRTQHQIHKED